MSFVFYDTETTGTETAFDQILQFAAVKTDHELNEVERFEIRCRLLPHIVPAPGAMRVTRIKSAQLHDTAYCSHYEMVSKIAAKLNEWSPAVIMGYNSLDYDEHILRQAFYKTLYSPYLTNSNGNCRNDVLRLVRASTIFAPDAIKIPTDLTGRPVFKLDQVAPANGFDHADAHDALCDVRATIHLCRSIRKNAPQVWSNAMRFSQKASVIDYVTAERMFGWSEFYFGNPYAWVVTPIGRHAEIKGYFYVYDLQVDPETLAGLSIEKLTSRLARSPKPIRQLKANAAPVLTQLDEAPSFAAAKNLPADELERRCAFLENDEALRERLMHSFEATRAEKAASPHIELRIYDGFWKKPDEILMTKFHAVPWENRREIVDQFQDDRLKLIGHQLIFVERPDLIEVSLREQYDLARAQRLLGIVENPPWLTLDKALEDLEEILSGCEEEERSRLQEHKAFLIALHDSAKAIVANNLSK